MIDDFLDQTCTIYKVVSDKSNLNALGKPSPRDEVVATLNCRTDPTRYRSFESAGDKPGQARESDFSGIIYTEWTSMKITPDMRMSVEGDGYYNIVNVNPVLDLDGVGHHMEIEVQRSFNA